MSDTNLNFLFLAVYCKRCLFYKGEDARGSNIYIKYKEIFIHNYEISLIMLQ